MRYLVTFVFLMIATIGYSQTVDSTFLQWKDGTWVVALKKGEKLDSLSASTDITVVGPNRVYNEVTGDFYVRNPEDSTFILVTPTFDTLAPSGNVLPLSKYHIYHNTSDTTIWMSYGTDSTDWIQISN